MARVGKEEREKRLAACAEALLTLGRVALVQEAMAEMFGVTPLAVRRWIYAVRKQWAEEAALEEKAAAESGLPLRESRRHHTRQMLFQLHGKAMSRTEIMKDSLGNPIEDKDGNIREIAKPNYSASLQALRQLRALDALDQPKVTRIMHSGSVQTGSSVEGRTQAEEVFFLQHGRWPTKKEKAALPAD